jgi:ABC-type branched-subunit amino acid transport system permease subunit
MTIEFAIAYIDPGSGSLFIQVLIATILAVPYFLRTQIGRAWRAIRRPKEEAAGDADSSSAGDSRS